MKLYGVLVVQNEGDVIEDLLEFLRNLNIFEKIFFFDLGSEDDTFIKAQRFKDILHNPQILNEVFTDKLKYNLLAQHQTFYKEGDWLAIIDADEFYVDNPIDLIKIAENENANCIKTYQVEFMFTDIDLMNFEKEDLTLPIYERRKYYLIASSEERFYKFLPGIGFGGSKPCSKKLLNRHYQYRTPAQIETRIKTRLENKKKAQGLRVRSLWPQVFSDNWKDYMISHKILQEYTGGEFKFGIPKGVQWKDYYSTKNAFSIVLPQIATVLMKDRATSEAVLPSQEDDVSYIKGKKRCEEAHKIGKRTFPDYYADQVFSEVRSHVRACEWKEAIRGLLVLLRYYPPVFVRRIYLKLYRAIFRVKNTAWNVSVKLKRFALRRSSGSITAHPNPIYEGYHDWADSWTIGGWAWDANQPNTPIKVDIYADNILLATVTADEFRPVLVDAGKGNGYHDFHYPVPLWLKDGKRHSIRVKVAGTNIDLGFTPKEIIVQVIMLRQSAVEWPICPTCGA